MMSTAYGGLDTVYIADAKQAATEIGNGVQTNLYVSLGWVPGIDGVSQSGSYEFTGQPSASRGSLILGILNGAENFAVSGKAGFADGVFSKYYITPVVEQITGGGRTRPPA
jgi:hypothetical protein